MCDGSSIVKQRQRDIRRLMDKRGIHMKVVASDSGIPYATLATYFPADANADPAQIPGGAIYSLVAGKALPSDLISLLMPVGYAVVAVPENLDHNELGKAFAQYIALKNDCHDPDSECGPAIGPNEHALLDNTVVHLPLRGTISA